MCIRNPGEHPVFGGLPLLYRWLNTGALNTKQDTKDAEKADIDEIDNITVRQMTRNLRPYSLIE